MLKSIVTKTIHILGFDIQRYNIARCGDDRQMMMLSAHKVNLVFDIGANTGGFAILLRKNGYQGRIISFEPLSAAHSQLLKISRKDPFWEVAPRAAIGNQNIDITINVAGNSESSSILNMLESHSRAAPEARYIGKEKVPLRRIDSFAPDYLQAESVLFLKIDTQGFEDRVLEGATGLMDRIVGIQLELSLLPLYENQRLFDDLLADLKKMKFDLWSIDPVFADHNNGRLLQVDATLFRR